MPNQPTSGWAPLPESGYNARNLELGVRDMDGVVANLYGWSDTVQEGARQVMANGGHAMYELAYLLCPKDTQFMAQHLKLTPAPSGLGFELGWAASDFFDAGFAFYPYFQELGTHEIVAQPCLAPAWEEITPQIKDGLGDVLRNAGTRRR